MLSAWLCERLPWCTGSALGVRQSLISQRITVSVCWIFQYSFLSLRGKLLFPPSVFLFLPHSFRMARALTHTSILLPPPPPLWEQGALCPRTTPGTSTSPEHQPGRSIFPPALKNLHTLAKQRFQSSLTSKKPLTTRNTGTSPRERMKWMWEEGKGRSPLRTGRSGRRLRASPRQENKGGGRKRRCRWWHSGCPERGERQLGRA